MEISDEELIEEIRGGSSLAFERLMTRYERLVFKVAFGVTGEREAAKDVTQSVFLKVHGKLGSLRSAGVFRSWIARIAMNESFNWNRTQRRHEASQLQEDLAAAGRPQEDTLRERETWDLVRRALATLQPKHRAAVALRYFEGLSIREIGSVLGCSDGVVKSILFRSVQKMRVHVKPALEVPS